MDAGFSLGVGIGLVIVLPLLEVIGWRIQRWLHRRAVRRASDERLLERRLGQGR